MQQAFVTGDLHDAPFWGEIALEDDKPAGGLDGVGHRMDHWLSRRLFRFACHASEKLERA